MQGRIRYVISWELGILYPAMEVAREAHFVEDLLDDLMLHTFQCWVRIVGHPKAAIFLLLRNRPVRS